MGQKNQYAYADAASRNTIISESELNITGAYSGSTQYAARDVVLYSGALYIALAATISVAPQVSQSETQYTYADAVFRNTVVPESALNMLGAYSGSANYTYRDVVQYVGSLYVALVPVSGIAPFRNHSEFWALLTSTGTISSGHSTVWSPLVLIRGTGTVSVPSESFSTLTMKCPDDDTQHTIYLRQADGAYTIEIDPTPL